MLLGFVLGTVLFVGLSSQYLKDEDREWMARAIGAVLLFCATGLACAPWCCCCRAGRSAGARGDMVRSPRPPPASAWLSTLRRPPPEVRPQTQSTKDGVLGLAVEAGAPVFLALLAGALSVLTNIILVGVGAAMPRHRRWAARARQTSTASRSPGRITTPC